MTAFPPSQESNFYIFKQEANLYSSAMSNIQNLIEGNFTSFTNQQQQQQQQRGSNSSNSISNVLAIEPDFGK